LQYNLLLDKETKRILYSEPTLTRFTKPCWVEFGLFKETQTEGEWLIAMSKKKLLAAAFNSVLLASFLATIILVSTASANMYIPNYGVTDSPIVFFLSPSANETCNTRNVLLTFTVAGVGSGYPVRYSLDGNTRNQFYGSRTVSETLSGLSEGQHKIEVSIMYKQVSQLSVNGVIIPQVTTSELIKSVSFTVESSLPSPSPSPTVTILLPQNNSIFNVSLEGVHYQLTYETNSILSWVGYSIGGNGYSIEGKGSGNVTVSENGTLVRDFGSSGYHTLTLYANDTSGKWAIPQSVTYLVNVHPEYTPTSSPSPNPIPTLSPTLEPTSTQKQTGFLGTSLPLEYGYVIVAVLVIIVVAELSLVYLKKLRK
jgi:hypothetical protein